MPAIDFPASPSVNDEYSFEGRTWLWNGTGWEVKSYPAALQLGSASAPSLYFTGDPNTGLYSPGADQVAITTGGVGRLFVAANGTVSRTGDDSTVYSNTGSTAPVGPTLSIVNTNALDSTSAVFSLSAINTAGFNSTSWIANIATPEAEGDFGRGGTMIFGRRSGNNNLESLRITRTGRVGIGTTTPGATVDIKAAAATAPLIVQGSSSEFARIDTSGRLLVGTSTARTNLYNSTLSPTFQIEGTSYNTSSASILSNGTTTGVFPYFALGRSGGAAVGSNTIVSDGFTLGELTFQGTDGTEFVNAAHIRAEVDGTPGANDMPGRLVFSTTADGSATPTERLRITSDGKVGIGTSSPQHPLQINAATAQIRLEESSGSAKRLELWIDSSAVATIAANQSAQSIAFQTTGTERARIDSSGRLLVGTSTAYNQSIDGNSGYIPSIYADTSTATGGLGVTCWAANAAMDALGGTPLLIKRAKSNTVGTHTSGSLSSGNGVGSVNFLASDGSNFIESARIASFVDGTPGTNDMPGRLVFSTTADGAASPTERMRIDSAGNVGLGTTAPLVPLDIRAAQGTLNLTGGSDPLINLNILNPDSTAGTGPAVAFSSIYSGSSTGALATISVERVNGAGTSSNALANDIIIRQAQPASPTLTERLRIDSSGRLLVGTSANDSFFNSAVQIAGSTATATQLISRFASQVGGPYLYFSKSRSGTVGTNTIVLNNDELGTINFHGADGSTYNEGARIQALVDGTPGANDMPGRLVFSTTLDGAASPTEAFRITNDRVRCYNQADPAAVNTTATLTAANLKTGIITSTTAAAVTMTLPTGTDTEAGFSGIYTNMTFEWSVINTGATNAVTVQGGTGHTLVGSGTVAASNSGRFASRRTASNTFVTYRLSS